MSSPAPDRLSAPLTDRNGIERGLGNRQRRLQHAQGAAVPQRWMANRVEREWC
jgi:hypothetical protein